MKNFAILIFLILIGWACSKEETSNPTPNNNIADFPNEIGYKWLYQFTDLESGEQDTMRMEIVGETRFQDRETTIWERNYFSGRIDSLYVSVKDDTVRMFPSFGGSLVEEASLIFPLREGDSQQFGILEWEVIQQKDTTVMAGVFEDAFQVQISGGCCNHFLEDIKWFVPQVGFIYWEKWEFLFGPIENGRWELLSYELE